MQLRMLETVGDLPSGAQITGRNRESSQATDFFLLRYGTPDWPGWAKRGKAILCVSVGVLRDFGILRVTFHHYLYNF